MKRYLPIFFCMLLASFAFGPPSVFGSSHPEEEVAPTATESVESLKKLILKHTESIESIRVLCRGGYADPNLVKANTFYQIALSAKGPGSLFYDSSHGHDFMDWKLDPFRQVAYVTDTQVFNEYTLDRMYFRQSLKLTDPLPGSLRTTLFFMSTGLWPMTAREAPQHEKLPYMLKDVAASESTHLHLRPKLEKVGDRWCHVLEEPNVDVLWIDVDRGGCLLQRDLYEKKSGKRNQRYGLANQEETAPGIWLPRLIRNTIFNEAAKKGEPTEYTAVTTVLRCEVNCVEDSEFEYRIPAGALEVNANNPNEPPRQVAAGGFDQFDVMAKWIETDHVSTITADNPNLHTPPKPKATIGLRSLLPFLLVGTLMVVSEVYLRWQRD